MTKRRIVISEYDNIAAIFEDDRAVEFLIHRGDILLGDIFLAQVENVLPSIDAGFVNVGGDKMGFLHSSDVPGRGDLKKRLLPKQQLVVQVMKEPTGHKGPRVTTNISLPGRFLVMMPESKGISISRKIVEQKERARLKSAVSLIKPPGVGVIIRTEALDQKDSDIQEDFETLLERWQNIVTLADSANPPTLLYRDQDLLYRVIREAVNEDVQEIMVDSSFGLQRAQQLLQNWNMDKSLKVTQYTGNQPVMIGTGIDREIKLALQTKVPMPSGGYLYIQQTEALTVVDVNSGKFTSLDSQAETIKQTNIEACKEIARQLRLRNIGGMIIVDFIDMESRADQLRIMQTFENELAPDKAKPQIGQLSDLGLVEMTRHRQGQALSEIFTKKCTACNGTGHALEDFSWSPGDTRTNNVRFNPRQKFPVKQQRPQNQGVPRPAVSVHNKPQKNITLPAIIEPGLKDKQEILTPGAMMLNKPRQGEKPKLPADKPIHDIFKDKLYQQMGSRLANGLVAKVAILPQEINGILSRINPKANDIMALVRSIEASPNSPMMFDNGIDDDDADDESMDETAEIEPDSPDSNDDRSGTGVLVGAGGGRSRGDDASGQDGTELRLSRGQAARSNFDSDDEPETPVQLGLDARGVLGDATLDEDESESLQELASDVFSDEADDDTELDSLDGDEDTENTSASGAAAAAAAKRRGRPPKRHLKRAPVKPKKPAAETPE